MSSNNLPIISIIIPIHKINISLLEQSINSILNQYYPKQLIEISMTFDGFKLSKEAELNLINKLKNYDIKHHISCTKKIVGIGKARNIAFEKCNGDYIFLLDSDDTIPRNTLSSLIHKENGNDSLIIYGNHKKMNFHLHKTLFIKNKKTMHDFFLQWRETEYNPLLYFSFMAPGILISRKLFNKIQGFNDQLECGELIDFLLRLDEECPKGRISHVNEIVYVYRSNPFGINTQRREYVIKNNEEGILKGCERRGYERKKIIHYGKIGSGNSTYYTHYDKRGNSIMLPYNWL
jgi:glycosyltransferase involved in cell wall biosynthesis